MTENPAAKKKKTAPKSRSGKSDEALKEAVLKAALKDAAFDGFTDSVLAKAGKAECLDKVAMSRLFPDGPLSLIEFYSATLDRAMGPMQFIPETWKLYGVDANNARIIEGYLQQVWAGWLTKFDAEQGLPLNIRFLWELEEEIGSPHFAAGLKNRTAIPHPDSVVVSDTIWIAKGRPAMPYSLRGLLGADLVGFHTFAYVRHFATSLLRVLGVESDVDRVHYEGREVRLGVFPMGVDVEAFAEPGPAPRCSPIPSFPPPRGARHAGTPPPRRHPRDRRPVHREQHRDRRRRHHVPLRRIAHRRRRAALPRGGAAVQLEGRARIRAQGPDRRCRR